MDPIAYRGIERLLIVLGGIFIAYLGYRLFLTGITAGKSNLKFNSAGMNIIFSGTGPGLFFMVFGAVILIISVMSGGVSVQEKTSYDGSVIEKSESEERASKPEESETRKTANRDKKNQPTHEVRKDMSL